MRETHQDIHLVGPQEFGPYERAPIPMALVNRSGLVLALNLKGQKLLESTQLPDSAGPVSFCEAIDARNCERFDERLKAFCNTGDFADEPILIHCRQSGNPRLTRTFEISLAPCLNPEQILVHFSEVTSRLALEKELRATRRAAEAANRAKTYFLANMSHEIRTPLSAILGYVDLITSEDGNPDEKLQWSNRIKDNAQNLKLLIDDILDISCLEADGMESRKEEIDVDALLQHVQKSFSPLAVRKGLSLHLMADRQVPKIFKGDASRIRQILFNLVGNAMKFTEKGQVQLSVKCSADQDSVAQLTFDVKDTGPGMSRTEAQRLFKPFMQADVKYTRRHGGSGLGLALSQRLARALGGDVSVVKTVKNRGSLFRFELPLQDLQEDYQRVSSCGSLAPHTASDVPLPDLTGHRVLVVEDSYDNQVLVKRLLAKAGAEVVLAVNGEEGVEKAIQGHFSLVLMDIQMPVMDGYAAKKRLTQLKYDRPVVAFTAHSLSSEVDKTKAAGFHAHLTKPINKDKLYKLVSELNF